MSDALPSPALPKRVAVIGGGISGLAAAHRLRELDPAREIVLLEASDRLGGVLQTDRRDGYLIERSADMFTTREPWALDLCRRIGIADELLETNAQHRRAFVVRRGKLVPVPEGFTLMSPAKVWPIVTTPILSPLGKVRMALERFLPARRDVADESLASFVVRRFGRQTFDRLVQPLIGGIYTADPEKLSLAATLPQFLEYERQFGSVTGGMRSSAPSKSSAKSPNSNLGSGARYGMFLAPRDGMRRMIEAIAARLPEGCVRLGSAVESVQRTGSGWQLQVRGAAEPEQFDDLIVAAPAYACRELLAAVDEELAQLVGGIPHAGASVVMLGYHREQISHPLDGFGFVVPTIEKRQIIAAGFASIKFAGRAPEGSVLFRVFIGGALQPELAKLPDNDLKRMAHGELVKLLGIRGEPELSDVSRWLGVMPQYHVGHLEVVRKIHERVVAIPNFALAGNAYEGVGIPFCIHSGEVAAERIVRVRPVSE
jgi:oxygen-dependent protoporphyrinogen oxidase